MSDPLHPESATLQLGRVLRAHGLRGEVRVQLHWDGSRALFEAGRVWLENSEGRRSFDVEAARPAGKGVLLKLVGVNDRDAADALRDARVSVERSELEPLAPGEFYLNDLIGAQVLAPDGPVGIVESVEVHPSVDSLLVRTPTGELLQQPLVEAFLLRIDVEAREVVLRSRQGLF